MYKVYFAVYLSSQKCGYFNNIHYFVYNFTCAIHWKLVSLQRKMRKRVLDTITSTATLI